MCNQQYARLSGGLRSTTLAIVSSIALTFGSAACGGGQPPEPARSSGAELTADKPAAGPANEPDPELRAHMQRSFSAAVTARDALIDGDLPGAIRAGDTLANMDYARVMPPDWMQWVGRMQERARELGIAPNLGTAAQELAQLALVCGDCHDQHRAAKARVAEPPHPRSDPSEHIEDQMLRHQVGAEQMWDGLVFASEDAFRSGTLSLTRAAFTAPEHADEAVDPAFAARIEEVRALARQAGAATTFEERGRVYGELITRCATCHYLSRPAR